MHRNPTFTVFTGCMWGAKTSSMLLELERFRLQKKNVMLFKPELDDRYTLESTVVTHSGWSAPATRVKSASDIFLVLEGLDEQPDVVAVDEAFMLAGIADVLIWLYRSGISIVVASLDMSATLKPFKEIERMMMWATKVKKCAAVCSVCSKDAFYTYKKPVDVDHGEIHVGGAEIYSPRCANCHPLVLNRDIMNDS